jgi:DNA-binding CsgD family transcriptional regulator
MVTSINARRAMIEKLMRLKRRQRDCLRVATPENQSKMIARYLGISPGRVDKHITDAMRTMDVHTRVDAAKILRRQEYWVGDQEHMTFMASAHPLGAPPEPVAEFLPAASDSQSEDDRTSIREHPKWMNDRDLLSSPPMSIVFADKLDMLMRWLSGRLQNGLSTTATLGTIGLLTAAGLFSAVTAISLLLVLNALVHG